MAVCAFTPCLQAGRIATPTPLPHETCLDCGGAGRLRRGTAACGYLVQALLCGEGAGVKLAVDTSRDLDLLDRLRRSLAAVGVHAEVRDHLLSLIVFPAASKLPVCVFVSGESQFYPWDCERKRRAVADVSRVARELAAMVMPRRQLLSLDGEG
jgi:hypothetical protein